MSEELVSANRRKWLVAIQPSGLMREPKPQVVIVHAYSIEQAKRIACKTMAKGKYKFRTTRMWQITSCEELNDGTNSKGT